MVWDDHHLDGHHLVGQDALMLDAAAVGPHPNTGHWYLGVVHGLVAHPLETVHTQHTAIRGADIASVASLVALELRAGYVDNLVLDVPKTTSGCGFTPGWGITRWQPRPPRAAARAIVRNFTPPIWTPT